MHGNQEVCDLNLGSAKSTFVLLDFFANFTNLEAVSTHLQQREGGTRVEIDVGLMFNVNVY